MPNLKAHFRNTFLTGVFAITPIAVTVVVVWYVESTTRELPRRLLGIDVPFFGLAVAVALVYLAGLIVSSLIGRYALKQIDRLLSRIPVLRELYSAWKQVSLTPGGKEGMFAKVVLVPVESGHAKALGFTSGQCIEGDPLTCCVFVPAAPNPTNGRLYFIRISECQPLDMSVEEAFKFILSGGNYVPREVGSVTTASHAMLPAAPTAPAETRA